MRRQGPAREFRDCSTLLLENSGVLLAGESASPGSRSRRRQTAHIHRVAQRIDAVKTMARAGPGAIVLSAAQCMPARRGNSKWA